ncbi:pali-domain-containing protein [Xylariaceae sp. FL1272]|nr:pali-domain-containing protein [Xylariaceae sp. FL1272]
MLRPATPLAVFLFIAFALLLLSVLSTPIIQAIPLGVYDDNSLGHIEFGVFGYCHTSGCSGIEIGYDTSIFVPADASEFDLPQATRSTLSAILIIHPVAALLTLIMFGMAVAAHFHAPSHSSRYLCGLFIFGIIDFLACLLAFLIDVLLFVPHIAWGSWLVLAATIIVLLSLIVSCAMRRTLVGRKARKKRIAENAEMSGENYYNRQAQQDEALSSGAPLSHQPTVPSVSGANGPAESLPTFASYEKTNDQSSDERIPLTARTPSERSPNNPPVDMHASDLPNGRALNGSTATLPRDQYGNPIGQGVDAYGMRRGPSQERMNSRGRGGPSAGSRGRGGYNRGGYGNGYGPPQNGRGGYGPPGRGAYGPAPNGRGGYGPRGGYRGGARGGRGPPPPGYPGGAMAYDRRPSAGSQGGYGPDRQMTADHPNGPYDANPSMPTIGTSGAGYAAYRPGQADDLPRAESPPPLPGTELPIGQAVEMDERTGSPARFGQFNNNPSNNIRDSDTDVAGMLALQEARIPSAQREEHMSEGSKYSQEMPYVPARQAWNQGPGRASPSVPSPLHVPQRPQELTGPTPPAPGNYYEDVDPRFAEPAPRALQPPADDLHLAPGARSPTVSERSGFTSVSQRGVNPRWNPPPGQGFGQQMMPPRRPVNRNEPGVNILNSNPDFELPTRRPPGGAVAPARGGAAGGMIPDSAYPGI